MLYDDISEILITKEQLAKRIKELGKQITADYKDKYPVLVCILKGASVFFCDLIREIETDISIDFIALSSYDNATTSSGIVRLLKDLDKSIEGRHVIIVEDIMDTGNTLNYIKNSFAPRKALSIKICTLLDKPSRRQVEMSPDYFGFVISDKFAVGYGLDYDQKYRNMKDICVLDEKIYK